MDKMLEKIKNTIKLIKEGFPLCRIGDLYFSLKDQHQLHITDNSSYLHLEYITKQIALQELDEIKNIFIKIVNYSDDIKLFIENKKIVFNLDYDDGGKTSIKVCSEQDGIITWHIDLEE